MITAVDDYCNNRQRSFITEEPSKEQKDKGDFVYRWKIEVENCSVNPHELFDVVNPIPGGKVLLVEVRDKKYDPEYNKSKARQVTIGLTKEQLGTMIPKQVIEMLIMISMLMGTLSTQLFTFQLLQQSSVIPETRNTMKECGSTFMWRSTCSWDNWMKATTVEEAIEEFEQMYKKMLWKSVEGLKQEVNNAIDNFAAFEEYRGNKRW